MCFGLLISLLISIYFHVPISSYPRPYVILCLSPSLSLSLFVIRSIGGEDNDIAGLCESALCDDISIQYSAKKSVISGGERNYLYAEKFGVVNGGKYNGHLSGSYDGHGLPESQGGLVITGGIDNYDSTGLTKGDLPATVDSLPDAQVRSTVNNA